MANPLHLELLREGTETWNNWMNSHPSMFADLSEAHLEHLHLDNAHLIGATLSEPTEPALPGASQSATSECMPVGHRFIRSIPL